MANKARLRKTIGLTIAMGVVFTSGVYAKDTLEKVEAYLRPDFKVEVNGKAVKDATPLIYEGSSYLPFKTIGELLGAVVSWDESAKKIKLAMPVVPQAQPEPETPLPSTGGSGGTGTKGNNAPIVPPVVKVEEEITLDTPIAYEFTYEDVAYPTLVNLYKGDTYLRWKDIDKIPLDMGNPKLSKEKLTGEMYVHLDLVRPYWGDEVKGDKRKYVIVEEGTVSEDKLKALNSYFGVNETGYTISPLAGENEYTVLAKGMDKWFIQYNIRFWQSYDKQWNVSSTGWKSYPKESTGTPQDPFPR
ncbi:stalk domain-containing protein [Paenibacillus hodogayensis]|uniref:Stalk domain-containing protein n=1 Tax=Paenibacillus hodogayensis TaxID=279208 RepID=A0ABV5VP52_9BACL